MNKIKDRKKRQKSEIASPPRSKRKILSDSFDSNDFANPSSYRPLPELLSVEDFNNDIEYFESAESSLDEEYMRWQINKRKQIQGEL